MTVTPSRRKGVTRYEGAVQDTATGWYAEIHGTRARYRKGCSCEECKAAERTYRAQYRQQNRRADPRSARAPRPR